MQFNKNEVLNSENSEGVSHLCSALVHEIRNPMTVVKGFLQMITSNDVNDEKKKVYASIAISEIDRAENIINDFLSYSKPKMDKIENVSMANEIEKVINILQPLAILNGIQIFSECKNNSLIRSKSSLIKQCLINICKNAIESMENKGILSICTWEDLTNLYVEIKDTGEGMSEEQLKKLGQPFFSTKGDKGTGLGILATFNILKELNATVKVRSTKDIGTIFLLSFPLIDNVNKVGTSINEEQSSLKEVIFN